MSKNELAKAYDFKATEERVYAWWEENGFFKPHNDPNQPGFDPEIKPFVISIPPPNVTGELHSGHALTVSVDDLMIRYHRMKGIPTLWVPGSDHAGIATQLQVEKMLAKEGLTREEVGREAFIENTWEWKHRYGGIITRQIRRLGASCDWTRERFTLDDGLSRAVREAFVRLYDKGLIYRGPRLINWSPGLKTAVSDLEVEYSEEPGTLYYFKYMLADGSGYLPVATTRPETILGDTAVAVHPDDERYQAVIGKQVVTPILGRLIPVIADEYVEREFGGGALKVTPGHDPNDYAIAQRHNLEIISVLDERACVNANGGPYQGLDRFEARKRLWEDMRAAGLTLKEEPYTLNVPRSQRGGEIVEPMISTQWFVRIQPLADAALEAVRDGRIRIVPERFTKVYYNWLENIQDWCISRQLWWGHRIPVWYCADCGQMTVARQDPTECAHCGSQRIEQDSDVLDTWFSSGLWPFSTLGWPEKTADMSYFYPTTVMETGYDILFFWVARMIMMGLEFTGEAPFSTVYLHGLIRDEHGRKMSKTKGNVMDPRGMMDEFGTDALRFTMLVGSTPGNDASIGAKRVEANRNFINKVWNLSRFTLAAIQSLEAGEDGESGEDSLADRWIRARARALTRDVERLFQNYQYGEAGRQIYEFLWSEFADWYVEIAKLQMAGGDLAMKGRTTRRLAETLDTSLRLLHPFAPFVTEELWGHLKEALAESPLTHSMRGRALMLAAWPEALAEEAWEAQAMAEFGLVQEIVRAIRNLRSEQNIPAGKRLAAKLAAGDRAVFLRSQARTLAVLAHLDGEQMTITEEAGERQEGALALVVSGVEIYLLASGGMDAAAERARLEKELAEASSQVERLEKLLGGQFAQKAPPDVVEKERERLAAFKETAAKLQEQIK